MTHISDNKPYPEYSEYKANKEKRGGGAWVVQSVMYLIGFSSGCDLGWGPETEPRALHSAQSTWDLSPSPSAAPHH